MTTSTREQNKGAALTQSCVIALPATACLVYDPAHDVRAFHIATD